MGREWLGCQAVASGERRRRLLPADYVRLATSDWRLPPANLSPLSSALEGRRENRIPIPEITLGK